jgi:hypothetical protein
MGENRGSDLLTLEILRQFGVGALKPRRFLGHHLKPVRGLEKVTARRRQVHRSRPQVALQLRHLCLEGRLLASSGLGGFLGSGLRCGRGGLGSCWGDSESSLSYTKNKGVSSVAQVSMRKAQRRAPGALESIFVFQNPSFDQYPSSPAEPPNELRITQDVRFSVGLFVFFYDETPETNFAHPDSLGLGFAWGVSSSLTSNDFKFECDPCFR